MTAFMHGLLSAGTLMRRGVQRKGENNCKMSYTSVSGSVSGGVRSGERDLGGRSGEREFDMHPKSWTDFRGCIFLCQKEKDFKQNTRQNSR